MGSSQSVRADNVDSLRREIVALRAINQQLEHRLQERSVPTEDAPPPVQIAGVSRQRIEELVEQMLQNPDINVKYLPDAVERQLYRNVFSLALNVLGEVLKSSSVELLGHRIQLTLVPEPPSSVWS